jgi:hypothetical protein
MTVTGALGMVINSIPFRYRPEWPKHPVPVIKAAQKTEHPVPSCIPGNSGHSGQCRPFRAELCFPLIRVPAMCGENCCREIKEKTIGYWVGSMKSINNSSSKYISDAKIKEILKI